LDLESLLFGDDHRHDLDVAANASSKYVATGPRRRLDCRRRSWPGDLAFCPLGGTEKKENTMTANKAASETRLRVRRKMTRLEAKTKKDPPVSYEAIWQELRIFIDGMDVSASAKKGGLGRK
jgi:hypothetical protein